MNTPPLQYLPRISTDLDAVGRAFGAADARRLLEHDSMRVYYDVHVHGDGRVELAELPTTAARAALIMPRMRALADWFGEGVSFLDLACSPGYFMFRLAGAGIGHVTGVDAREDHHRQFQLLNHHYGYTGLRHVCDDIYHFLDGEIAAGRRYDVCLLFGFLYHTCTPVELLRRIHQVCGGCLVVDTTVNRRRDESLQLYDEPVAWSRASTSGLSMMPSLRAVSKLLAAGGFHDIERIVADPALEPLRPGGDRVDYYFDRRRAHGVTGPLDALLRKAGRRLGLRRQVSRLPDGRALYLAWARPRTETGGKEACP